MASAIKMSISSLLLLANLLLISSTSVLLSGGCHPNDEKALFAIKASVNVGELSWIPDTNCCNWVGVTCNDDYGRVISVIIDSFGGPGTIPSAVGDFTYLETLVISHHDGLTGGIPRTIVNLIQLVRLQLDHNALTGPIPLSLFILPCINYVDLSYNHFTGTIPPIFWMDVPLKYYYLNNNQFTGTIPESLGKIDIKSLKLSNNNLTGPLPASFANANFQLLDLSSNLLTGDASLLFGAKKPLTTLLFSRSNLDFDLTNIVFPDILQNLDLSHNKIYGSIPESLGRTEVKALNLSNNNLTGPLAASFANAKFQLLDLSSNPLTGDASLLFGAEKPLTTLVLSTSKFDFDLTNIVFPENLQNLDLSHNKIYGSIPESLGGTEIKALNLSNNNLIGPLPASFANAKFQVLDLSSNPLTGDASLLFGAEKLLTTLVLSTSNLDFDLTNIVFPENLQNLDLSHNKIYGSIPESLGGTEIKALNLGNNNLTGPLPASFANAKFHLLDLSSNLLTGDASLLFGAEKPLTTLVLSRSKLDFDLKNIVFPENLQNLDLSHNKIYGSIPESLGGTEIKALNLSNNSLTGPLPASFANAKFQLLDLSSNPITGDASLLFGANKPLTTLLLSRSKLDFDLTNIVFPENLKKLDLSHNEIRGSIPKQIAQLKFDGPTSLNVSYNHLCGKIPTGGQMGQFDQSVYIQNRCLCGSLCSA